MALKAIRGDLQGISEERITAEPKTEAVWQAVSH